ncbi:MAG: TonB-dependent receptor [Azoarcus sp.]|nr:TonB-dependent receptor [Azoarcus sp.]
MRGARVELEGGGAGFDVLVGVSDRRANDYDTPEGHARNSAFNSTQLDFNLGYRPTDDSRWELSGRYADVTTERAGGLGAAPGAPLQEVEEDPIVERYVRLGYQGRNFGALADTLDVALYRRDFKTDIYQTNRTNPAVTTMPHLKVYSPTVWGGHLTAMKGIGNHLVSYGADFFREDFEGRDRQITRTNPATGAVISQTPWQRIDRDSVQTNIGVFVSDEWTASEDWTFSGALRYDRVTVDVSKTAAAGEGAAQTAEFDAHRHNRDEAVTGSLGVVYKLTPVWSLAANLSRGFRAPSGNERVITSVAGTIVSLPAPGLKPEYNKTLELGLRWNASRHRGSVTAYESRYTDLIASMVVSPDLRQRKNIADATIRGLELEGQSQLATRWRLNYALAATHGEDKSANEPLAYITPLSARLALRFEPHGANNHYVEGVWRGYRGKTRIDRSQERKTSSYALFDVYAGARLDGIFGSEWRGWKLVAGVENLFDRKGQNPAVAEDVAFARSYTNPLIEPGRNFVVKLSADY